jgi:hypothetical protein
MLLLLLLLLCYCCCSWRCSRTPVALTTP